MKSGAAQQIQPNTVQAQSGTSEILLSGFSGAKVLLIRDAQAFTFIRKISASPAGNARLHEQAVKQRLTAALLNGHAQTPRILDEGHDENGLYYFDMEYIRGLDGISFLRTASLADIARFTARLCGSLEKFAALEDRSLRFSPRKNALDKCASILATIPIEDFAAREPLSKLMEILDRADMPDELMVTACHGDLTLENIVVTEAGEIVFIDLLDSFLNHWLADVAKLDQDLKAGWYMRKSPPLPVGVTAFVRKALLAFSRRHMREAPNLVPLLLCVHLARILPYTRTPEDRQFVLARLDFLLAQSGFVKTPERLTSP